MPNINNLVTEGFLSSIFGSSEPDIRLLEITGESKTYPTMFKALSLQIKSRPGSRWFIIFDTNQSEENQFIGWLGMDTRLKKDTIEIYCLIISENPHLYLNEEIYRSLSLFTLYKLEKITNKLEKAIVCVNSGIPDSSIIKDSCYHSRVCIPFSKQGGGK